VVVFSPQILENFRRGSAEGLSVVFIAIWLVGDVFNILGAVLQGVLPTMVSSRSLVEFGLTGDRLYWRYTTH
jgi:solute carrier family 66 (lysosomal lysine-arginine transporter), member 1